jgi:hypothetical protein
LRRVKRFAADAEGAARQRIELLPQQYVLLQCRCQGLLALFQLLVQLSFTRRHLARSAGWLDMLDN